MIRNFVGVQTLGATSMPAFGSTVSAATSITKDAHTNNTSPGSQDSASLVPLVSVAGFRKGDRVLMGPKANFTIGGVLDQGFVQNVNFQTNTLTVQGLLNSHTASEYVLLDEDAIQVSISTLSAANPFYIGNQSTVAANDGSVFDLLNQPSGNRHQSGPGAKTSEYWISGTAGDQFISYFIQL